jgi:hypothetical protein
MVFGEPLAWIGCPAIRQDHQRDGPGDPSRSPILRRGYSSEHAFEHLGDAVVAGRGREVVGGGNRVWMTA